MGEEHAAFCRAHEQGVSLFDVGEAAGSTFDSLGSKDLRQRLVAGDVS